MLLHPVGIRVIGTRRPEASAPAAKNSSKMAPTRVVQKVIMPSSESSMVRIR